MTHDHFQPRELDTRKPSAARVYHYMITGEVVFGSDLPFIERLYAEIPFYPVWARHNRAFLTRAVQYMVEAGVRQFLDIGSGLPTGGNTHEVARRAAPEARVVYVDNDEEAITRAHDLLTQQALLDSTAMVAGDLRDPVGILEHPDTVRLLDYSEPVGVLLVSVLPWLPDADRPVELVSQLRDALTPGSHIAMTHVSLEDADAKTKRQVASAAGLFVDALDPVTLRTRKQFEDFFHGWSLVAPGITYATDWRPNRPVDSDDPARLCNFAALGHLQ
ncbi:SAM-dependent methyltransferase [Nocardia gipuzkoensis]|uniref:SAM-dependent methyltransferase n=1 Tax=Nocardia gipuzkoensis TaxID=2749991 RepID=UPI00237D8E00|nr:SAM-dependent methyltransferase [Nocardia gipuzkoensis]MDE1674745.1 SAM-dependent methyltransferase [Nocardia gipuzkoensis]